MFKMIVFAALTILAALPGGAAADDPASEIRLLPVVEESLAEPIPNELPRESSAALRVVPITGDRQQWPDHGEVRVSDAPASHTAVANYAVQSRLARRQAQPTLEPAPVEPIAPGQLQGQYPEPSQYMVPTLKYGTSSCRYRSALDTGCPCEQCRTAITRRHSCLTYRKNRPFGSAMVDMLDAQKTRGIAARMVLYDYDFLPDDRDSVLSPRGEHQLAKYARLAVDCGHPIIIAVTPGQPQLNEARRLYVADILQRIEPSISADWVVVGSPRAIGLRGEEAFEIDINNLRATRQQGAIEAPASTQSTFSVVPGFGD